MPVSSEEFGKNSTGDPVTQYTLTNDNGMVAKVISLGGIISSLQVPGKDGKVDDVVLGFDNVEGKDVPACNLLIDQRLYILDPANQLR